MPKWSMMIDDADDDDVPAALVKGSYSTTTSVKIYFLLMKKVEEKFSKLFHQVRSCVNVSLLTDSRPIVRVVSIRSSRSGHHQPTTEKSFTKSWQCNQLSDIFYFSFSNENQRRTSRTDLNLAPSADGPCVRPEQRVCAETATFNGVHSPLCRHRSLTSIVASSFFESFGP